MPEVRGVKCAGCLETISPGDKFVLSGTEVFHRACIGAIRHSVGVRQQLRIIDLERQLAAARGEAQEAARLRTAIDDANREARLIRAQLDGVQGTLHRTANAERDARHQIAQYQSNVDRLVARAERAEDERDQVRADRDRLAREATDRNAGRQSPNETTEQTDDTRARFALLELD